MTEEEREELERLQLEQLRYQNRKRKAHQKINRIYLIVALIGVALIILSFGVELIKILI